MKILITNTVSLNVGDSAILEGILKLFKAIFGEDTEFIMYDSQPEIAKKYYPDLKFYDLIYQNYLQEKETIEIKYINRFKSKKILMNNLNKILDIFVKFKFYVGTWFYSNNLGYIMKFLITNPQLQQCILNYSSADLIVSTGGTYLVENYSLEHRIFDYNFCLFINKPLIFFSQSLGPFSIPKNRHFLKKVFEKSSLIFLRDQKSWSNLLELGVPNNKTYITADSAFALVDTKAVKEAQKITNLPKSPKVAISVRDWKYFKKIDPVFGREKYFQSLRDLTIHLVKKYNAHVTYISTCQGIEEYWTDDSKVAVDITNQLPKNIADSVDVDRNFHSPQALREDLKAYNLVIATRMHMAILALCVGIPVLPIAYEFKTKELFNNLGQGHWTVDIEEIQSKSLINSVDLFINSIAEVCQIIFPAVLRERERIWESSALLKKAVEC